MDMYHFLKLFRASICLCGGENREQFRWIVKRMDGQVYRSMDDNGRRINVQMFFMFILFLLAFTQPFLGFHICQQIRVTRAVTLLELTTPK